jgi:hypothetical protein
LNIEDHPARDCNSSVSSTALYAMDLDSCSVNPEDFADDWVAFDSEADQEVPKSLEEMTQELDDMLCPEDEEDLRNISVFTCIPVSIFH